MTQPPNPIMQGLRLAWRRPATFLLEILWRWSFGILAFLIVFIALAALLQPLHVTDRLLSALRAQDLRMLGMIGVMIIFRFGTTLGAVLLAIALGLTLLWSLFAAPVRRIVTQRLGSPSPMGFSSMLAVQWARAMVFLFAVLLLLTAAVTGLYVATRSSQPDLFRFYMICAPSTALVLVLWLVLNWYLSMAAIFGQEQHGFRKALQVARHIVRRQRSDFAGTAFIFLLLRVVALLAVVAIIGLTSSMMATAPQSYAVLVAIVVLVYFVISDFLYVARIASYLALAAAYAASAGPPPSAVFTIEKSSPL